MRERRQNSEFRIQKKSRSLPIGVGCRRTAQLSNATSVFCLLNSVFFLAGCARPALPGSEDVPPGLPPAASEYQDVNPRWSHDGSRIAFLRQTPDRSMQLFVADARLAKSTPLLEPELLCPDRGYRSSRQNYASGDTLAWSPDDRQLAFERTDWFVFDDGERLPGTGLWSLELRSGRVAPLVLHPLRYESRFYYYHTPAWSPDGRYFAFVGEGINGQRVIGVRPLAVQSGPRGASTRSASFAADVVPRFDSYEDSDWPVWGKEGFWYRQSLRRTFSVLPTETWRCLRPGRAQAKTGGEQWRLEPKAYARERERDAAEQAVPRVGQPVWSPDGNALAFTVTPDANDWTRYELWVWERRTGTAHRGSPNDGRGYFAPVWIDGERLGALSPQGKRFAVVMIATQNSTAQNLGTIASADCDWSPDRSRIVYVGPPATPDSDDSELATTLRLFSTGRSVQTLNASAQ